MCNGLNSFLYFVNPLLHFSSLFLRCTIQKPYKECLTNEHVYAPDKKILSLPNKQYHPINFFCLHKHNLGTDPTFDKYQNLSYNVWCRVTNITGQNVRTTNHRRCLCHALCLIASPTRRLITTFWSANRLFSNFFVETTVESTCIK